VWNRKTPKKKNDGALTGMPYSPKKIFFSRMATFERKVKGGRTVGTPDYAGLSPPRSRNSKGGGKGSISPQGPQQPAAKKGGDAGSDWRTVEESNIMVFPSLTLTR